MTERLLQLRALDAEDLEVVGALLQDAIVPLCDMVYDAAHGCFAMVVHRFRWEIPAERDPPFFERVHCAVEVSGVRAVDRSSFPEQGPLTDPCGGMLELLTVTLNKDILRFIFAGGAEIALCVENGALALCDYGDPWPTALQPEHKMDGE